MAKHKVVWTKAKRAAFARRMAAARRNAARGIKHRAQSRSSRRRRKTKSNPSLWHGTIIRVVQGSHTYYYTADNMLSINIGASKKFSSVSAAKKVARRIARQVPKGTKVYILVGE